MTRVLMSQRQQDELSVLTSIFSAEELSVQDNGGVFRANVQTPASLVVTGVDGTSDALTHLPPLSLHFNLPTGYPDTAPPSFMLSGHWLSRTRLSRLCHQLDELYEPGQEVLFTWFSFLQDETWSFLHLPETLSIAALQRHPMGGVATRRSDQSQQGNEQPPPFPLSDSAVGAVSKDKVLQSGAESRKETAATSSGDCGGLEDEKEPEGRVDSRAVVEIVQSLRDLLVAHALDQAHADFERSPQECAVCFVTRLGAQSVKFSPCGHVVCRECATCWLRGASLRGATVTCPGYECSTPFPHHLARQLLSEEEFQSYDGRLLESALSSLADIVRCPRTACQYAVTREQADGKLATCFHCRYAFCADCRQGYHGVEPCRFRPDEQQRLISEYTEGSASEREALEKRYGKRRLEGLLESSLTKTWLEDNSKPCPHCKAGIQKAQGCNKMICWRCNTHFCWLCAAQLDPQVPYAHYLSPKSPCHRLLFQGIVMDENEDPQFEDEYIEDWQRPAVDM